MKRLIGITLPDFFSGESEIIRCLFDAGLSRLHLRKPGSEREPFVALLKEIPQIYYPRLILHDHFDILFDGSVPSSVGGLHLNRRSSSFPAHYTGALSRSCHSFDEVKRCLEGEQKFSKASPYETDRLSDDRKEQSFSYEYIFLSPLFPSISKEGYGSGFSLRSLREAATRGEIGEKVIALGGLSAQTIPLLKDLPFGGVAVLGSLWGKQPGLANLDEIIDRYKQLQTCLIYP